MGSDEEDRSVWDCAMGVGDTIEVSSNQEDHNLFVYIKEDGGRNCAALSPDTAMELALELFKWAQSKKDEK